MKHIYIHNEDIRQQVSQSIENLTKEHNYDNHSDQIKIFNKPKFADTLIFTDLSPNTQEQIKEQFAMKKFAKDLEGLLFLNDLDGEDSYTILQVLQANIQKMISKEIYLYTGSKENILDDIRESKHLMFCEDLIGE